MLFPHWRPATHSESVSQSPPPTSHGLDVVQQLQSVEGTPLHTVSFVGVCGVVDVEVVDATVLLFGTCGVVDVEVVDAAVLLFGTWDVVDVIVVDDTATE